MFEQALQLPASLAVFQDVVNAPTGGEISRVVLRWAHFVAGIAWIGMLYFFNLVNVNFMKALDAPTKKVVIPELMPRALWYFRWGAAVTVFAGLTYYAMYILPTDVTNARAGGGSPNVWVILLVWLLITVVAWVVFYFLLPRMSKDGRVLAAAVAVLMILMSVVILWWLDGQLRGGADSYASNKTLSIGVGGAMGIFMLLNVWGIIWRAQKRIIAGTVSGDAAPPELARQAFLASRTNAWLSLPMLFFMATSHGDYIIFGKN